jgi:acyl-CoA synthetase (AMP-forming)/AMP-acid ligase II
MEFDEVPVEVCVDIGVDGPVNLFALLDQAAQRFPDRGSVDPGELDAHLLQRIARFKRPKRYLAVDQLPKNSYGKVLKRELRRQLV